MIPASALAPKNKKGASVNTRSEMNNPQHLVYLLIHLCLLTTGFIFQSGCGDNVFREVKEEARGDIIDVQVDASLADASLSGVLDVEDTGIPSSDLIDTSPQDTGADVTPPPLIEGPYEWHLVDATSDQGPQQRYRHFAAYDSREHRMLLGHGTDPYHPNGGCCQNPYDEFRDLWALDLTTWTWILLEAETEIPHIEGGDAVYDSQSHSLWVIGARLYRLDLETMTWTSLMNVPGTDMKRHILAPPTSDGLLQVLIEGNSDDSQPLKLLTLDTIRETTTVIDVAHPDGVKWHFSLEQRLLSGGYDGECSYGEVWKLNAATNAWEALSTEIALGPRLHHQTVWDSVRNRLIIFGGFGGCYCGCNETGLEVIDLESGALVEVMDMANTPAPRRDATLIFDTRDRQLILFGGAIENSSLPQDLWRLVLQ